LVKSQTRTIS